MRDLQAIKTVPVINPGVIVDNDEFPGSYNDSAPTTIDRLGFYEARICVMLGATDIAIAEMELYECDTSDGTFTAVPDSEFSTKPSATDDNEVWAWFVDLSQRQRYLQVHLKAGDGTSGTYAVCWADLYRGDEFPNTAATRGLGGELLV